MGAGDFRELLKPGSSLIWSALFFILFFVVFILKKLQYFVKSKVRVGGNTISDVTWVVGELCAFLRKRPEIIVRDFMKKIFRLLKLLVFEYFLGSEWNVMHD